MSVLHTLTHWIGGTVLVIIGIIIVVLIFIAGKVMTEMCLDKFKEE